MASFRGASRVIYISGRQVDFQFRRIDATAWGCDAEKQAASI
jgi:hypothetical protein